MAAPAAVAAAAPPAVPAPRGPKRHCVPDGTLLLCHACADHAVCEFNEMSRHYKKAHVVDHPEWLGNTPYHLCRIIPAVVIDALDVSQRKKRPFNAVLPPKGYKSPPATVQEMRDFFRMKGMAVPAGLVLIPVVIPDDQLAVAVPPVAPAGVAGGPVVAAAAPAGVVVAAAAAAAPAAGGAAPVAVVAPAAAVAPAAVARNAYDPAFDISGKRI